VDAFMRNSDAFSWYMERDPVLRSTVVAVAWLDSSPDWETFVQRLDAATRRATAFRQRLVEPPGRLAPPRWTFDDAFELSSHLRRIDAPAPRTAATVLEIARLATMTAFDHARPLWEFTLVEHLEDDKAALVMKLHHSLTDGVGGMELALLLFDATAEAGAPQPLPIAPEGERLGTEELVEEALGWELDRVSAALARTTRSALPTLTGLLRRPVGSLADLRRMAISIGRTVAPVRETLSPVMLDRGLLRRLDVLEVDLADLKHAAKAGGGTLNDTFLAAVAGGLRRYHERHGAVPEALRLTMPISLRKPDDPMGGNRITLMRFTVPVAETDPVARIDRIGAVSREIQGEPSLEYTNAIAGALNLLPTAAVAAMLKKVDFLASNVTGFPFPVYLAGAPVAAFSSFSPTIGSAVNLTLISYAGTCSVGMNIDAAAVPDHGVLVQSMREGFDEVLALGGRHARARLPLHERRRRPAATRKPAATPPAARPAQARKAS